MLSTTTCLDSKILNTECLEHDSKDRSLYCMSIIDTINYNVLKKIRSIRGSRCHTAFDIFVLLIAFTLLGIYILTIPTPTHLSTTVSNLQRFSRLILQISCSFFLHPAENLSVIDTVHTVSSTAFVPKNRRANTCTQTVQVPVWYGTDYNTCSMQITTAPCLVSFPTTSCHTARPVPPSASHSMSDSTNLGVGIGLTISLIIFIPLAILWARWKLSTRRRGARRSTSIQLERRPANSRPKATSGSSSTPSKPRSSQNRSGLAPGSF